MKSFEFEKLSIKIKKPLLITEVFRKSKWRTNWHTYNGDLGGRSDGASWIVRGNRIFAGICLRAGIDLERAQTLLARCRDALRFRVDRLLVFLPGKFDRFRRNVDGRCQLESIAFLDGCISQSCHENWCSRCEQRIRESVKERSKIVGVCKSCK